MNIYHLAECQRELTRRGLRQWTVADLPAPPGAMQLLNREGKIAGLLCRIREQDPGWSFHFMNPNTEYPGQTEPAMTPAQALSQWLETVRPAGQPA